MARTNYNKISTNEVDSETVVTEEPVVETEIERVEEVEEVVIVAVSLLNVRKEPSLSSDIVRTVTKDTKLTVLGRKNGFIKINDGYVAAAYVK